MSDGLNVLVLGGGTGGYVAAIRAAQLGLKVAVVEKDKLGGTCLHRGCIPSKALLRSAEVLHTVRQAAEFGFNVAGVETDWSAVQRRKEKVVRNLHKGVESLLKKHAVQVINGRGTLMPPSIFAPGGMVLVQRPDGERDQYTPEHIILATGSRPRTLGIPIDGEHIFTSDEALTYGELPASIIIIGGGAIGMEWASLYSDFGVEVTVVEALPRILPLEDPEVSAEVTKLFGRRKVKIHTSARVLTDTVAVQDGSVTLEVEIGGERKRLVAQKLLVSVGRDPNSEGIGLDNYDEIHVERGYVKVDEQQRTAVKNIYAIGDLIGGALAHVAAHQGIIAVEAIAGKQPHPLDIARVPRCTYTRPEVASVGLTEDQARELGHTIRVARFPFRAIGKALVYGEVDGFCKMVADAENGDLLGVHMVGPHVTDFISEAGLAQFLNATAWEVGRSIHPHPTLSEILGEAALAVDGQAIHM